MVRSWRRAAESRQHRYQRVKNACLISCELPNEIAWRSKFVKQVQVTMPRRESHWRVRLMKLHKSTSVPADSKRNAPRRLFIAVQASKTSIGAALALAFVGFVGRPDAAETIAIAGLLAPAFLVLLAFTKIPLAILEQ